jgi:endonuclease YncB( thermonuclease family)
VVVSALNLGRSTHCLAFVVVSLLLGAAAPAPIIGRAHVIDGDTLTVAGVRIRLWGIDAPEGRQSCHDAAGRLYACGEVSTARMRGLVADRDVTCVVRDHDQYGRSVSQCRSGERDLGAVMVDEGLAVEYRQFDGGAYAMAEAQARKAKRGLWAGAFEQPSAWRSDERREVAAAPQPAAPGGCLFKGNVNARGSRIVHAPGQRDYAATRIDTARGERWFCSLEAATAAGWTAARR